MGVFGPRSLNADPSLLAKEGRAPSNREGGQEKPRALGEENKFLQLSIKAGNYPGETGVKSNCSPTQGIGVSETGGSFLSLLCYGWERCSTRLVR